MIDSKGEGASKDKRASKPLETVFEVVIQYQEKEPAEAMCRYLSKYEWMPKAEVREVAK